jgi:hypothetical protein
VSVAYVDLVDYVAIAAAVTGLGPNFKRHARMSAHVNVVDNTGRMRAQMGAGGEDRDPKWLPNGSKPCFRPRQPIQRIQNAS